MWIPTETVVFNIVTGSTETDFGETLLSYEEHAVEGCLVEPASAEELGRGYDLLQETLVKVHVPKGFTNNLNNAEVTLRGESYEVVASPVALSYSPLDWNRYVIIKAVG